MSESKCRWGFLSAAWIGMKNWQSVALSGNGELVAVASRDRSKAEAWIDECSGQVPFARRPEAVSGYDALLARDDIDAVYLPLPTGVRADWAIKAAQAGKHVLCEKPCGVDVPELESILDACKAAGVQFMDGVMFVHSKRLDSLRRTIDDGSSLGQLQRIVSQFSFCAEEDFLTGNIRMHSSLEPLGCLGDLGWYNIRFSLWAMDYQMPERVSGRLLQGSAREDSPNLVPTAFSGELFFPGNVTASFYCSFLTANQQWANLCGTQGNVHLDDFVVPCYGSEVSYTVAQMTGHQQVCDFNMERRERRIVDQEYSNGHPSAQETQMIRHFSELVLQGKVESHWSEIALKTQKVMMAALDSSRDNGAEVKV